jgi:hypothetical protein
MRVMTPLAGDAKQRIQRMNRVVQLAFEPAFGNGQTPHYGL